MSKVKISLQKISDALIADVKAIEASSRSQGEKTLAHKRAAKKAMNALFLDKKKYGGDKVNNRIKLATFSSYLARLRRELEALGFHHHLLEREAGRMVKRYPLHAHLFQPFLEEGKTPAELRQAKLDAKEVLQQERQLADQLNAVNYAKGYKAALIKLAKEFPDWRERIEPLVDQNGRPERLAELRRSFAEVADAWADLDKIKIDHEAIVALAMPKDLRESLQQGAEQRLADKQRSTILIDYPTYMRKLGLLLTQPWATFGEVKRWDFDMAVFALCGATGRRPIEIILLGNLEKIDNERLRFTGSAKKRDGVKDEARVIYSLFPTDMVMAAFTWLRSTDRAQGFASTDPTQLRTQEVIINGIVADKLNQLARRVFYGVGQAARLYDTRAIYARICYERWFQHDTRWERVNEDGFFSEILGHDDPTSQLNYKSIKLDRFDRKQVKVETMPSRVDALAAFDDKMADLARGDAAVKLHQWVKEQLAADPGKVINQTVIVREYKAYRPMVKAYLELVGDALMVPDGLAKGLDLSFLDVPVTVDDAVFMNADKAAKLDEDHAAKQAMEEEVRTDANASPAEEVETERQEQDDEPEGEPDLAEEPEQGGLVPPKFRLAGQAGQWQVTLTFGDLAHRYESAAPSMTEACQDAWEQWLDGWDDVAIKSSKAAGWTTVSAQLPNGQTLKVEGRGKIDPLRAQLMLDIEAVRASYQSMSE